MGMSCIMQLDKGCLTRPHAGAAFFCLEQAAQDAFATLRPGLPQHAAACRCLVPRVVMGSPYIWSLGWSGHHWFD